MSTETPEINSEYAQGWTGRGSLATMVTELRRQLDSKLDVCIDPRQMQVVAADDGLRLAPTHGQAMEFLPSSGLPIQHQALPQIGERVTPNVPTKFLRKLGEERPEIAAELLTKLLHSSNGGHRFIRCLDGRVRAFLSSRYKVLDHYDLVLTRLQAVQSQGGEVIESSLSERSMRLKFTSRSIFDAIEQRRHSGGGNWYAGGMGNAEHLRRVGARTEGDLPGGPDTVHPLVTVSNSETGHGGLQVRIGILRRSASTWRRSRSR